MKTSAELLNCYLTFLKHPSFHVLKCCWEEETDGSALFPADIQEQQGKPQQLLISGAFFPLFSEVTFSFPAGPWPGEEHG